MTEDILKPINNSKFFKPNAVALSSFLAGPLAGGYMIAQNYKELGEPDKQVKTIVASIVILIVLLVLLFTSPIIANLPMIFLPILYSLMSFGFVHFFQNDRIKQAISEGAQFHTGGRTASVVVIVSILYFSALYGISYLLMYYLQV